MRLGFQPSATANTCQKNCYSLFSIKFSCPIQDSENQKLTNTKDKAFGKCEMPRAFLCEKQSATLQFPLIQYFVRKISHCHFLSVNSCFSQVLPETVQQKRCRSVPNLIMCNQKLECKPHPISVAQVTPNHLSCYY